MYHYYLYKNYDIISLQGTLTNRDVREWYITHDATIPDLIDRTAPIEEQARQAEIVAGFSILAFHDAIEMFLMLVYGQAAIEFCVHVLDVLKMLCSLRDSNPEPQH